ncbi:MAG: YgjP-like metallopeptidase domain-containing protein [Ruthenibacterium sp.]
MPQPEQECQFGALCYTLTRKKVKNINLRVRTDGSVALSAPMRCPMARIEAFLAQKLSWIQAAQVRAAQTQQRAAVPCTVNRQAALVLYTQVSDEIFPLFATLLHGQRPLIKVRDMKTRWGVCKTQARQLTFNLRLAEKPRAAVEYVVLHEYAHFVVPNHSPAFWAVVARYMPDYKARRAMLR